MGTPNSNWPKWLKASIYKHFDARKGTYTLSFEGQLPKATSGLEAWAELRVDGPYCQEISKDYWELYVEVNALISAHKSPDNLYAFDEMIGQFLSAFTSSIDVLKYGNGVGDNEAQLGCLAMLVGTRQQLQVSQFGQIEADSDLQQAVVEAHYQMHLET